MARKPSFDSLTLAAVVRELQPLLGARVQKVSQPGEHEIILSLYKGTERFLLISGEAQSARAHLTARLGSSQPPLPAFLIALRRCIRDSKLVFARQRGFDRILELGFAGEEGDFQIVAELMGKHSNVMLVDHDRRLVGALKWIGPQQSRRPILPGKAYVPPPFESKPPVWKAQPGDDLREFEGVSPFLGELIKAGLSLEAIESAAVGGGFEPHRAEGWGVYPLDFSRLTPLARPISQLSAGLDQWYGSLAIQTALEQRRSSLLTQLSRTLLARETALAGVDEALATARNAGTIQEAAELILAYQGTIQPGASLASVWDMEGQERVIPLNPELSAVENANALFGKARHAKQRAADVRTQRDRLYQDAVRLQEMIDAASAADSLPVLEQVRDEAERRLWLNKAAAPQAKEDRPFEGHSIRELLSPAGFRVLYGLNATSNDYLTTKVAKPSDYWFHVRGQTSAHVILQTSKQPDKVQRPDLVFAAEVAARNSIAKHSKYIDVDYTLKKYVRKPNKSAAGSVLYTHEKTLSVESVL